MGVISMTDYIYALLCPKGEVRYVGKSSNPSSRLRQHISAAKHHKSKYYSAHWIRSVLRTGATPTMQILAEVPEGEAWEEYERHFIKLYKDLGFSLTNTAPGGEGSFDQSPEAVALRVARAAITKSTPEYREKASKISSDLWSDPEVKAKRLVAMAQARAKPGHYEKRVAAAKEIASRPEVLKKRSEKMKKHYPGSALDTLRFSEHFVRRRKEGQEKRWSDPEEKEKVRLALLDPERQALMQAAANSPEAKAKRAAKMSSIQSDPEYLANLSAKTKAKWEEPEFRAKMAARQQALYDKTHTPEHLAMMRDRRNAKKREKRLLEDPAVREQRLAERRAAKKAALLAAATPTPYTESS